MKEDNELAADTSLPSLLLSSASLIDHLQRVAREVGCYKVILCCDDKNVAFYAKLGFHPHANHLACYFEKVGGGKKTTGDA